jgi:sugar-specific transcriptional regulator TrmB
MAVAFNNDPDALRKRLRLMTDKELVRYGKSCCCMASPAASYRKRSEEAERRLRECIEEWRRRYPVPLDRETLKKLRDHEDVKPENWDELMAEWPE